MDDPYTAYRLKFQGDKVSTNDDKAVEKMVANVWLTAAARLVNVVGVPLGLGALTWVVTSINSMALTVNTLNERLLHIQRDAESIIKRVDRLERPFFNGKDKP